jgi:hypothetical protein
MVVLWGVVLYNISEEHTASIFSADSPNITWHETQQTTIYIHITMKTSNPTYFY